MLSEKVGDQDEEMGFGRRGGHGRVLGLVVERAVRSRGEDLRHEDRGRRGFGLGLVGGLAYGSWLGERKVRQRARVRGGGRWPWWKG